MGSTVDGRRATAATPAADAPTIQVALYDASGALPHGEEEEDDEALKTVDAVRDVPVARRREYGRQIYSRVSCLIRLFVLAAREAARSQRGSNLSRYILVGAVARVIVTFYTKVGSNLTSELKSETAKAKISSRVGAVAD